MKVLASNGIKRIHVPSYSCSQTLNLLVYWCNSVACQTVIPLHPRVTVCTNRGLPKGEKTWSRKMKLVRFPSLPIPLLHLHHLRLSPYSNGCSKCAQLLADCLHHASAFNTYSLEIIQLLAENQSHLLHCVLANVSSSWALKKWQWPSAKGSSLQVSW